MGRTVIMAGLTALLLGACGPELEVSSPAAEPTAVPAPTAEAAATTSSPPGRSGDLDTATSQPTRGQRGVTGRAQVEVPDGWTESSVDDAFDLRYLAGEADTDPMLSLAGDFGQFRMSRAAVSTLIAQMQIGTPGFTIHAQEDIEVQGANNAVRVDFSWGTEDDGGVFDGMWVLAVADDGDTIALAYSGGAGEVTDVDKDALVDSFRLLPGNAR